MSTSPIITGSNPPLNCSEDQFDLNYYKNSTSMDDNTFKYLNPPYKASDDAYIQQESNYPNLSSFLQAASTVNEFQNNPQIYPPIIHANQIQNNFTTNRSEEYFTQSGTGSIMNGVHQFQNNPQQNYKLGYIDAPLQQSYQEYTYFPPTNNFTEYSGSYEETVFNDKHTPMNNNFSFSGDNNNFHELPVQEVFYNDMAPPQNHYGLSEQQQQQSATLEQQQSATLEQQQLATLEQQQSATLEQNDNLMYKIDENLVEFYPSAVTVPTNMLNIPQSNFYYHTLPAYNNPMHQLMKSEPLVQFGVSSLKRQRTSQPWSKEESKLLMKLRETNLTWKEIASQFKNRTCNACQFRWKRLLMNGWKTEDDIDTADIPEGENKKFRAIKDKSVNASEIFPEEKKIEIIDSKATLADVDRTLYFESDGDVKRSLENLQQKESSLTSNKKRKY
ncbi:hypothetical protein DAMA08_001790 [Martiniozyma asiatica (nom. inval.)]|nr:hypothetical protein DAMA08_001790 [Martiniozyma asiatica]